MTTTRFTLPEPVAPMLASAGEPPFGPGWAFEFKWDGVRTIAAAADEQVRLHSRKATRSPADILSGPCSAGWSGHV